MKTSTHSRDRSSKVVQTFPKFLGDPTRLSQIITNLISNALKFTFVGSIDVLATVYQGGNMLKIEVADSGIGIPKEKQEIVFEALRQVDESADRKFGGTGLGLAISRDLSRLMGGELSLRSKVGEGTTFSCAIPFHKAEVGGLSMDRRISNRSALSMDSSAKSTEISSSARRSSRPSSQVSESESRGSDVGSGSYGGTRSSKSGGSRRKQAEHVFLPSHSAVHNGRIEVLSVDDEMVNQKVVASILRKRKYKITQAFDGKEAIALLKERRKNSSFLPDIILLDVVSFERSER